MKLEGKGSIPVNISNRAWDANVVEKPGEAMDRLRIVGKVVPDAPPLLDVGFRVWFHSTNSIRKPTSGGLGDQMNTGEGKSSEKN